MYISCYAENSEILFQKLFIISAGTPPLTPLANLKVLIAAASTAMEKQQEGVAREEEGMEPDKLEGVEPTREGAGLKREALQEVKVEIEDVGGRKMKSLAVLCKK